MFENPIAPKKAKKKIKSPWNFEAPNYDQRSGPSVAAGDYYGTGFKNPMGKSRDVEHPEIRTYPKKSKRVAPESVV